MLGESIGDLAGAKIAYRAFKISQRGKAPAHMTRLEQAFAIAKRLRHVVMERAHEWTEKLAARRHARAGSR